MTMPNRSSIAMESSIKSSESSPSDPSSPFGRVVSMVMSAVRARSNLRRATRIALSASRTSLRSMPLHLNPAQDSLGSAPYTPQTDVQRRGPRGSRPPQFDQGRAREGLAEPPLDSRGRWPSGTPAALFRVGKRPRAGLQEGAGSSLHEGAPHEPTPAGLEIGALVEGLDGQHQCPLARGGGEQGGRVPEGGEGGRCPTQEDRVGTRDPELDGDLGRHRAGGRVREVERRGPGPLDERPVRGAGGRGGGGRWAAGQRGARAPRLLECFFSRGHPEEAFTGHPPESVAAKHGASRGNDGPPGRRRPRILRKRSQPAPPP